ncbi:P-loop containing nucleoside triphosphate hydrolase protein [Trichoderma sp. SZMC 28014]
MEQWIQRVTESPRPTIITPSWLLERNVKLVEHASLHDHNPCKTNDGGDFYSSDLSNITSTAEKGLNGGKCGYECATTPEIYAELVDMTKQAFNRGNQSAEQYSQHPAICLQSPVEGCLCYMQPTLESLARDVDADLISLGPEDIIDLSLDLSYQCGANSSKNEPLDKLPSHYFGFKRSCSDEIETARVRKATSLVINAARTKRKAENILVANDSSQDDVDTQMTIMYIKDGKGFLNLPNGTKILKSFRTLVQERRLEKERILLLVSTYSDEPVWDLEYPAQRRDVLHRKILVDELSIIDMTPASNGAILKPNQSCCILNTNLRHFKRAIRQQLPTDAKNSVLSLDWEIAVKDRMSRELNDSLISDLIFARAARQIARQTQEKLPNGADDICEVMLRLLKNKETTRQYGKLHLSKDAEFNERLVQLGNNCDRMELKLLDCLVNPKTLKITLEDVVVEPKVKEIMKQLLSISNFRSQHLSQSLFEKMRITGALLYGPPGTGKTHLTRAIAKDMGMNMVSVTPAAIQSKYVGESEKTIQALFSLCTKLTPCILFIDEADSLFFKRSASDKSWERSFTNQFLQEMDGLTTKKDTPFVLVATNRPEDLDEAFLRRLPQKVEFKLPSKSAREQILNIFLKDTALHPEINTDILAEWTEGFSGSDLQSFCIQAALIFSSEERNRRLESNSTDGPESLGLASRHFSEAFKRTYKSEWSEGNVGRWQPIHLMKVLASQLFQIAKGLSSHLSIYQNL